MVLGTFKLVLRLRDRHVFMWQSVKILNVFSSLTLKHIFWKTKTFFKKLENYFLVGSTKIENASFPCKTAISGANVKKNTKWTYHKERSFTSNYLIFWKLCLSLRTCYKKLICCTKDPNAHIYTSCKRWSFIWGGFFPVSIPKKHTKEWSDYVLTRCCALYKF